MISIVCADDVSWFFDGCDAGMRRKRSSNGRASQQANSSTSENASENDFDCYCAASVDGDVDGDAFCVDGVDDDGDVCAISSSFSSSCV